MSLIHLRPPGAARRALALLLCLITGIGLAQVPPVPAGFATQNLSVAPTRTSGLPVQIRSDARWVTLTLEVEDATAVANSVWGILADSPREFAINNEIKLARSALDDARIAQGKATTEAERTATATRVATLELQTKTAERAKVRRRPVLKMDGVTIPKARIVNFSYAEKKIFFEIEELPPRLKVGLSRDVPVALDYDDRTPVARGGSIKLIIIEEVGTRYAWMWCAEIVLVIAFLGMRTNLLRDVDPKAPDVTTAEGFRKCLRQFLPMLIKPTLPFSLARCQMAFWTIIVAWGWLYLWLATNQVVPLSDSVLGLMGIAGATLLFARTIDRSKNAMAREVGTKLAAQQAKVALLTARADQTPPLSAIALAAQNELPEAQATLTSLTDQHAQMLAGTHDSNGLLNDLLSDDGGISIHRLQMVLWTLVLGVFFIRMLLSGLAMPEINPTLLALMGISSGTYVGFKRPE